MPICLGEATKFSQYLLDSDKRYRVVAQVGSKPCRSVSQGVVEVFCLPKTAWPPTSAGDGHAAHLPR
ncbi:hypothetical protein [Enterobacter hormaechei]